VWGSCKGSQEGTRGYTCGLWLALHSLAAHAAPEDSGGAFFMASLRCTQRHLSSMLRVLQRSAGFMSAARAAAVACGVIRLTALALQGLYQTLLPVLRVLGALSGAAERQGRCSRAKPRRCGAVVVACAQPGSIPSLRFRMPHDAHVVPQVCRVQNMCKRRAPLHVQTASGLLPRR